VLISGLLAPAQRLAVVGLAKNTGKTETLGVILRELAERELLVGVTSIGRDGEARDAIDSQIEKPSVWLCAGSLVASTDALLRASGIPCELLEDTGIRTPLGRVLIARVVAGGAIEVAGPSTAQEVRRVADAMLAHGAHQVMVDGAIDRRAASSPSVCDGVVMATGAVLSGDMEGVVTETRKAVELIRLPEVEDERLRVLAAARQDSFLVGDGASDPVPLHPRFALTSTAQEITGLLRANPQSDQLVVRGAVCEPFLRELLGAMRGRAVELVVENATKVFLGGHGIEWYRAQGLTISVLASIRLLALTVNPCAPRSHSFESRRLRWLLEEAIPGVPVLDVRDQMSNVEP
jgi:hypothetical protein